MPVMTQDWAFCRWMAIEHGLVAIPTSAFYTAESREKGLGRGLVRFCFCKTEGTLDAAADALLRMARDQPKARDSAVKSRSEGLADVDANVQDVEAPALSTAVVSAARARS